jgi:hypothetical protein
LAGRIFSAGVSRFRRSLARARFYGPTGGDGGTAKRTLETCQPCASVCTVLTRGCADNTPSRRC